MRQTTPLVWNFSIKVDSLRTKPRWMQAKMSPEEKESSKDSTAVAENRMSGGVGEVAGAILLPRPDLVYKEYH